jgi:hypothetical protein
MSEAPGDVQSLRDSVVALARAQIDTRYVLGGTDPARGFDCSGLVRYVLAALDLSTPRTAQLQATIGTEVVKDPTRLRPGDLLTFSSSVQGVIDHVGIYVGNGRYIHASSAAGRVVESQIPKQPRRLSTIWQGARRLMAFIDPRDGAEWKAAPRMASALASAVKKAPAARSIIVRRDPPPPILATLFSMTARLHPRAFFAEPAAAFVLAPAPTLTLAQIIETGAPAIPTSIRSLRSAGSPARSASRQ